jgi:hypothetical protein
MRKAEEDKKDRQPEDRRSEDPDVSAILRIGTSRQGPDRGGFALYSSRESQWYGNEDCWALGERRP